MTNIYNDNQLIDSTHSQMASREYQKTTASSTQDLLELYDKMVTQRQYIADNNTDHSLDNILETTDRHISMLRTIIPTTHTMQAETIPYPHYRPYINNGGTAPYIPLPNNSTNTTRPNADNLLPNIDNNPTPPLSPDNRPNNTAPNPFNNNNIGNDNNSNNSNIPPNNDMGNSAIPPTTQPRRTTRNSPLQSGILSNIVKSFFRRKVASQPIVADEYRNRFHNGIQSVTPPTHTTTAQRCDPCRKIVTNECNILRLILLYITLHPHCNRIQLLSTIAEERVQILSIVA